MEIITYVLDGALQHKDSMGNGSVILPGEVQLMSAGTGVTHSEMNPSKTEGVHFLQIWVIPAKTSTTPRYDQRAIPKVENGLSLLVSPDGAQGSVTIGQDARIWRLNLQAAYDARLPLAPGRRSWVQVIYGAVSVNGVALAAGDGAALTEEQAVEVVASQESELLVFDLKA
jgi:redox-sensitive bicupin YhaK (pirin superfamily)